VLDNTPQILLEDLNGSKPVPLTGNHLAKNRLPAASRTALAVRLLGGEPINNMLVSQAAELARVPRRLVDKELKKHRPLGLVIAEAFAELSIEDQIVFVNMVGCERLWNSIKLVLDY
jgi:hypothetical protein